MSNSFWIILTSFLAAANAGLLGNFLLLRKQAMIGDAISHAVLPGIAIAFMLTNTTNPLVLFCGAALAGLGATLLIGFFEKKIGVTADIAIGITFTTFFALGVVLVSLYTQKADLDQQCVLYGNPVLIPFDLWMYGDYVMGPQSVYILGVLLVCNGLFIGVCYRALLLTSFDPGFANVIGMNTVFWHYVLMFSTALTTVASFKVVGAVLVVALLVVPSATAYLLADGLLVMILYTLAIDAWVAYLGYVLALWMDSSMVGAMVSVSGVFFVMALIFTVLMRRYART